MTQGKEKPNAPACERNREVILAKIRPALAGIPLVLELGSGTGQHGVFFALNMPWLQWQCSERQEHLSGIEAWRADSRLDNVPSAIELDFDRLPWSVPPVPAIFTANTLHIVSETTLENFFRGVGMVLEDHGLLFIYGPFKYGGDFTSDSNARFDLWLKERDGKSGIKDFERVIELATEQGLVLEHDHGMPANNQLLVCRSKGRQKVSR